MSFFIAQVNFRITIRMVGEVATGDYHRLQVFNIILRKAMGTLKLQLIGRNFFDAVAKVKVKVFLYLLKVFI